MNQVVLAGVVAALGVALALGPPSLGRLRRPTGISAPRWWRRPGRRPKDTPALAAELPAALGFLAVCLDAGQPMVGAVDVVARVSPPATRRLLQEVAAQLALGRAGPEAWEALRGHPVWGRAAADIARSERSGTALTAVLRMHADDGRRHSQDAALKAARTVGVRSVIPLMACFLPAFMLIGVVPIIAGLLANFFR